MTLKSMRSAQPLRNPLLISNGLFLLDFSHSILEVNTVQISNISQDNLWVAFNRTGMSHSKAYEKTHDSLSTAWYGSLSTAILRKAASHACAYLYLN